MKRAIAIILAVLALLALVWIWKLSQRPRVVELPATPRDLESVMIALEPVMEPLWQSRYREAGVGFPGERLMLIGLKAERRLQVVAVGEDGERRVVADYPVFAASGVAGPKLREGDRQVPEGEYPIVRLNPNSRFHLSFEIGYPNPDERERAAVDGRDVTQLGGDIMVHGGAASTGCLAIGDPAIEELFYLVARIGIDRARILIVPCDFRSGTAPVLPNDAPAWTNELHAELRDELNTYPQPK